MSSRNIFIIMPFKTIGGAEKRLMGFWLYANRHFSAGIKLVMRKDLFDQMKTIIDFKDIDQFYGDVIFEDLDTDTAGTFRRTVRIMMKKHIKKNDILHFVSAFPVLNLTGYKTIFSFTGSSLANFNWKGKFTAYLGFVKADLLDILDPIIYNSLSGSVLFRKKANLTPNSYVDPSLALDIDFGKKKNQVIHLGRFQHIKQVDRFIAAFPVIDALLKKNGINDAEFVVIGSGPYEEGYRKTLSAPAYSNIKWRLFFSENPYQELKNSKIIVSIQAFNNYPSKALLEGMICGCLPVVTDVGATRNIAKDEFSYFIGSGFSATDLAEEILTILKLDNETFKMKAEYAIGFVKNNCTIEKMSTYYLDLYNK